MPQLEQIIEMVKLTDNTWLLIKLLEIKTILNNNPNDLSLGKELRKFLS